MIISPKGSLEFIIAGIASIFEDNLVIGMIDGGDSSCHIFVFCVDGVTLIDGKISIVFFLFDDIDGMIETSGEMIFHFDSYGLKVLIVVSFVLKEEI